MKQKGIAPILIVVLVATLAVGGYLIYKLPRVSVLPPTPQTTPVPSPTPSPSPAPTGIDEITNWKTYTSKQLGFSVKIPSEFNSFETVEGPEAGKRMNFAPNKPYPLNKYWVWISITPNVNQLTVEKVVDNYLSEISPEIATRITRQNLKVAGVNAISLYQVPSRADTQLVYIATNEKVYLLGLEAGTIPDLNEIAMSTFNQILSTFKFLP